MQNIYGGFIPKDLLIKQAQPPAPTATPPSTPTPPKPTLDDAISSHRPSNMGVVKPPVPSTTAEPTPEVPLYSGSYHVPLRQPRSQAILPSKPQDDRSWLTRNVHSVVSGVQEATEQPLHSLVQSTTGVTPPSLLRPISRVTAPVSQDYSPAFTTIADRLVGEGAGALDPVYSTVRNFAAAGQPEHKAPADEFGNLDALYQTTVDPTKVDPHAISAPKMPTNFAHGEEGRANRNQAVIDAAQAGAIVLPGPKGIGAIRGLKPKTVPTPPVAAATPKPTVPVAKVVKPGITPPKPTATPNAGAGPKPADGFFKVDTTPSGERRLVPITPNTGAATDLSYLSRGADLAKARNGRPLPRPGGPVRRVPGERFTLQPGPDGKLVVTPNPRVKAPNAGAGPKPTSGPSTTPGSQPGASAGPKTRTPEEIYEGFFPKNMPGTEQAAQQAPGFFKRMAGKPGEILESYGKSTPNTLVERLSPLNALGRYVKGTGDSAVRNAAGAGIEYGLAPLVRAVTGTGAARSSMNVLANLARLDSKGFGNSFVEGLKATGYSALPMMAAGRGILSDEEQFSSGMGKKLQEEAGKKLQEQGTDFSEKKPEDGISNALASAIHGTVSAPSTMVRNVYNTATGTGIGGFGSQVSAGAKSVVDALDRLGFDPVQIAKSTGTIAKDTAEKSIQATRAEATAGHENTTPQKPDPLQDTQPASTLPQPPQQFTPSPEALRQPATVPTREVEQHIRNVMMTHPKETQMIAETMGVGALTGLAAAGKQLETIAKLPGGVEQFNLNVNTPGTPEYNNALNNLAADYMREQGWKPEQISQLIRQNPLRYPTAVEQDGPLPPLEAPQPQPEVAPQPISTDTGGNLGLQPADAPAAQGQNPFVSNTPTPQPISEDSYSPTNPPGYLTGGTGGKAPPAEQPAPEVAPKDDSFWGRITDFWNNKLDSNGRMLVGLGLGVTAVTTLMNLFGGDDDEDDKGGGGSWFSRILPFLGIGAAAWGLGGGTFSQLPSLTTMGDNISSIFSGNKQGMIATFTPKSKIRLYDKNMRRVYA